MKKALIIGIDDYPTNKLNGCTNDANDIANLLRINDDGSPNFDVNPVHTVKTKAELLLLINDLFEGNSDVALLYFSGHGSSQGNLVTPDAYGFDSGVSMNEVLGYANNSKANNKIIILDCCYSGRMGELSSIQSNESIIGNGVTIMTACSADESAMEECGHGVFTNLLVQALHGSAADVTGKITPANIYSFIDQTLGAWHQRPIFKTNTSKFISLRNTTPRVSMPILRNLKDYFEYPGFIFQLNPSFEFTNSLTAEHKTLEPYANATNVEQFKELQLYASIGLVEPVGEDHMYFAAMNSKSCKLTPLGVHYWRLANDKRF